MLVVRRLALFAVLALLAGIAPSLALAGEKVTYPSGAEKVEGYLALPQGKGPFPALVVVPEWWGLNDWVRAKADQFAAKGYAALAVDIYRGKVASDPDTAHELSRALPTDRADRDLRGAFSYLSGRKDVDPKRIGIIGWCMGGGLALDLAEAEPSAAAVVVYYGRLPTDATNIARIKAPMLGNFGAEDKGIPPESVHEFQAKAEQAGVKADLKVYPGAGHAFASDANGPMAKAHRPEAAKDADARTDAFLARTLKKG
jgi:carboxymethylenebutenolidase